VDLTPSILEFITGEVPGGLQGVPFARRNPDDVLLQESWRSTRLQKDRGPRRSAIRNKQKWTFRFENDRIEPLWHSDLATDPGELRPDKWDDADPDTPRVLLEVLQAELVDKALADRSEPGFLIDAPKRAPPLEPHQREALEALGYLDGSVE
jgi:hypothetical protein